MVSVDLIDFEDLGDDRGHLISLEQLKNVPFPIKRIYYMFGMDRGRPRGFHAHKALRQLAVCIKGSCNILLDDGIDKTTVIMDSPTRGLMIEPMQWHEMSNFSNDCILLVLANDLYDESDYIRNYVDFINVI